MYCYEYQENFDHDNLINPPPPKIVRVSREAVDLHFAPPASSRWKMKNKFKSSLSLEKIKKNKSLGSLT